MCMCMCVCVCERERERERERAEDCLRAVDVYDSDADNGSRSGFFDVQNIGRCRCM